MQAPVIKSIKDLQSLPVTLSYREKYLEWAKTV